jgi:hypothetical protein
MGRAVLANNRQFRIASVKHERTIMKILVIGGPGLITGEGFADAGVFASRPVSPFLPMARAQGTK